MAATAVVVSECARQPAALAEKSICKPISRMIIYNLFPLLAGNVRDWKPHLVRAADMGFDWIFINPIQFPGFSGSLYSIKDYFDFNPLIADGASPRESAAQF